jgi:hypothetical protein
MEPTRVLLALSKHSLAHIRPPFLITIGSIVLVHGLGHHNISDSASGDDGAAKEWLWLRDIDPDCDIPARWMMFDYDSAIRSGTDPLSARDLTEIADVLLQNLSLLRPGAKVRLSIRQMFCTVVISC